KNITIKNNTISSNSNGTAYGIYMDAGDSIFISKNNINGVNFNHSGYGISCYNIVSTLEVDSNTISNFLTEGIRSRPTTGSNWKIRYNNINNIQDAGIFAEGTGGAQYLGNRITAIKAGTGIVVNGPNATVANNYIQTEGLGISKGISLRSGGTGSSILFNSVNVTGIDIINGQALEVLGGNNYTIKNNIFANNGGGYAAYVTAPVTSFNLDYNDYYSTKRRIAFYQNTKYDTLSVFAAVTGKDANSKSVNPFYTSVANLQSNHTLLNETGAAIASVANDIDSTLRSATPDIGAKEFSPCPNDAGVNEFWGLSNPLPVGNNDIQVVLQNQGTNLLTSATIYWQVNGIAQTPIVWNGYLPEKEDTIITIGSYNFPAGKSFQLKAWTADPNTLADCNTYNDTINVFDLATPLCGVYTIGGVNPDFTTFYDASVALNNAGVACPVIFKVRNGSYNEQIKLYDIPGASVSNTVLFEGENGDSTLAEIHYQLSNPSNDFTISLTGADYITFQKMGIRRTNGTYALLIQNNAHHVTAQNCRLGNVISPNTSCDSVLTFRFNNMQGFDIDLQNPDNNLASNINIENNYIRNIIVKNSTLLNVRNNRGSADPNSYCGEFTVDKSKNILIEKNRAVRM
ncbi:MAG: right-handed parallel beta-helix repeat-containing protein, partial [Bacteroidota bacterium]